MSKPRVAVVGAGVVGTAMQKLCGPETVLYDVKPGYPQDRDAVNACDVAFLCVPTPMGDDGACDTRIVEASVAWIETPLIVLRSTVPPGTTDHLIATYDRRIVFQPEYLGETTAHVFQDMSSRPFAVLGGTPADTAEAAEAYKHYYNAMLQFHFCDARTAELAKYMENCFYALKVTFVNEFYDIAAAHGVPYDLLREMWLADPRISRDHTFVYRDERGFSGKCLPKDLAALLASCHEHGYNARLLQAVQQVNERFRARNQPSGVTLAPRGAAASPAAEPEVAPAERPS